MALVRTSSTVFNKSDENGHLYFVSDLKGKTLNFSPLRIMLTVDLY